MARTPRPTDRDLYRFTLLYDPPEFVKDASVVELLGAEEDDPRDFVDMAGRVFCVRTKAATWAALAHFLEQRDAMPEDARAKVAAGIERAISRHGIEHEAQALHAKRAAGRDERRTTEHHAWVVKDAAGRVIDQRLPLDDAADVESAIAWLGTYRDKFAFDDRMRIARRIIARGAALDVGREKLAALDEIAAYGMPDPGPAIAALRARAAYLRRKSAEASSAMHDLAGALAENPAALAEPGRRLKLAAIVDSIDRAYDIQPAYDRDGLLRPEAVFFGITEKVAADRMRGYVTTPRGDVYRREALAAVSLPEIREKVGDAIGDRISADGLTVDAEKAAAALGELPLEEATALAAALRQDGASPVECAKRAVSWDPYREPQGGARA